MCQKSGYIIREKSGYIIITLSALSFQILSLQADEMQKESQVEEYERELARARWRLKKLREEVKQAKRKVDKAGERNDPLQESIRESYEEILQVCERDSCNEKDLQRESQQRFTAKNRKEKNILYIAERTNKTQVMDIRTVQAARIHRQRRQSQA